MGSIPNGSDELRYGFIGLGIMGWGMANNLRAKISKSASFTVCEIVESRLKDWVAQAPGQAEIASSPRAVVERSDVIFTVLPKGPHIWDAFTNPETGLLSADPSALKGKLFIDCSTIDIETSKRVHAEVHKFGAGDFVDAPVSGGVRGATIGTLSIMVGADTVELFDEIKPTLSHMGNPDTIFYCGKIGAGLATKQINNYLSCVTMVGTCEAMNMGIRSGLDPALLSKIINVSTGGCYNSRDQNPVKGVSPISSAAKDFQGGFSTELCQGVLEMAIDHGRNIGANFVLADTIADFYGKALKDERCRGKDYRSIWKLVSDDMGGKDPCPAL